MEQNAFEADPLTCDHKGAGDDTASQTEVADRKLQKLMLFVFIDQDASKSSPVSPSFPTMGGVKDQPSNHTGAQMQPKSPRMLPGSLKQ